VTGYYILYLEVVGVIFFLNVYAPTESKNNDIKDSFEEELEHVLD
jgi:hypothetical protein